MEDKLKEWQNFYNDVRPHSSLDGKSPIEKYNQHFEGIPSKQEISKSYDASIEDYRARDYAIDQQVKRLRLSS